MLLLLQSGRLLLLSTKDFDGCEDADAPATQNGEHDLQSQQTQFGRQPLLTVARGTKCLS